MHNRIRRAHIQYLSWRSTVRWGDSWLGRATEKEKPSYTVGVFLMLLTKIHWWDTHLTIPRIASSLGITFQLQWCFISMEVVQGGESSATHPCLNAYVTQNEWLLADIKVDETNWLQTVCFKSNSRRPSFVILTSANAISREKINYPCLSIQLTEVIKPTLQTVQGTLTSFNGQDLCRHNDSTQEAIPCTAGIHILRG